MAPAVVLSEKKETPKKSADARSEPVRKQGHEVPQLSPQNPAPNAITLKKPLLFPTPWTTHKYEYMIAGEIATTDHAKRSRANPAHHICYAIITVGITISPWAIMST